MKTFLWTTLFWIVVAIAGLLCLGFGNLGTQVLDNTWMIKFLPENMQTRACEPVVASAMETIDWCEKAQEADCNLVTAVETGDLQGIQEAISDMVLSQNEMKSEIKEALESMEQKISGLGASSTSEENTLEKQLVEKREQQKKELQSQIEALQAEMENL